MFKFGILVLIIGSNLNDYVICAKILQIFNFPSRSMHLAGVRMAKVLAESGHNVTTVSPFEVHPKPEKFLHVYLNGIADFHKVIDGDMYGWKMHPALQAYSYASMGIHNCNLTLSNPTFRNILDSKEKYNLVILLGDFSESLVYVAKYLDVPLIVHTSLYSSSWSNHYVGNSAPPSFIPNILSDYTSDMSFFQRFDNALLYLCDEMIRVFYTLPKHDKLVKHYFPGAPDISSYINMASILFVNSDTSIYDAVPQLPGMIYIGGYHIEPPRPLPKDLEYILNNAEHGVIYFSMGSNIKSSRMPNVKLQALLKVFAKLKQIVLWKWEDEELLGKPSNVVIRKWLPQNDILAHKNVKLFITHGGFYSNIEAVYHGVPCVAIAVFVDQISNAIRAAQMGYAEWMKFDDLTDVNFGRAVNQLLTNSRYTEMAKRRSRIMRDKPLTLANTLIFWVNYVIRHNGAEHFKVASLKYCWYQYYSLDIIVFSFIILYLSITVMKYLFRNLTQILLSGKKRQKIE